MAKKQQHMQNPHLNTTASTVFAPVVIAHASSVDRPQHPPTKRVMLYREHTI